MGNEQKKSVAIQLSAKFQLPASNLGQLPSSEFWDGRAPTAYRWLGDTEGLSDGGPGSEEPNDVFLEHWDMLAIAYRGVKDGLPVESYPNQMETMGDRIKQLRQSKGWTQEQLGDRVGVSKMAVSAWETGGTANIRLKTFLALCEEFGTTPQYLAFGPDQPRAQKPTRRQA
jgi:DNA-binding XRE family transcriptional regulator